MASKKLPEHGTRGRYRMKCGCAKCRKWKADDTAAYRARKAERDGTAPTKRAAKRARPTSESRPTDHRPAPTARAASGDDLVRIIEAAIFDAGDTMAAAVLAARMIREAGWRHVVDGPIEAAARDALDGQTAKATTRMQHELVFRGARSLDDPANARYYASTVEAMRKVLADIAGPDGDGGGASDIVDAIRRAGRDGDGDAAVDDTAEPGT
ncbi:hypothetical protein [Microbacterium sp. J1-1]|uniref:hypothetical protein n=1 Tax=Microbacterium sp. J1-1 TaxID=2992441 RepID=UPI0021152C74|nr:hypothetical protein [Microbacterium sp. J1-1]UUE19335.1 hypothetical protein LRQ07_10990 [Microbacterium sp. J1-1]